MPCKFEGVAFSVTIVDADSGKPLPNVHVLAEWLMIGGSGRTNGPVMVLDAVSGVDGVVRFPAWGPVDGSVLGLDVGQDPVITFFKTGYRALAIDNRYVPPGDQPRARVRRAGQDGQTYELRVFRGSPDDWLRELDRVAHGVASRPDSLTLKFKDPYRRRLLLMLEERPKIVTANKVEVDSFLFQVDRELKFLEEGHRR
jgi:hypothetical protein